MTAPLPLPPSQRDFEIFFAVAIQSVSTRRAAERHNLSQTRIRQIVTLVADWVADNLPDWGEADLKKQVRLAQHVAANRLEHQYEQAMIYWNAEGDPKYLRQAARIALAQARLGILPGRIHALAADATAGPSALGDPVEWAPPTTPTRELVTRVPPGNAPPRGSSLAEPESVGCQSAANSTTAPPEPLASPPTDHGPRTTAPLPEDCSRLEPRSTSADAAGDPELALTASPASLNEHQRHECQDDVEAAALIERRLLILIANLGDSDPDKLASLNATLVRVRASKATAELRLSRFHPGIQVEPPNAPPQKANPDELVTT